jgi:hypothetical protein
MAGPIISKLFTDFFNEIGPSRHFAMQQNLVAVGAQRTSNKPRESSSIDEFT